MSTERLYSRILQGEQLDADAWQCVLQDTYSRRAADTRGRAQEVLQGVAAPQGYGIDLAQFAKYGRIVDIDSQPKDCCGMIVKDAHGSSSNVQDFLRDPEFLRIFLANQDAEYDVLLSLLREHGPDNIQFIIEGIMTDGDQWKKALEYYKTVYSMAEQRAALGLSADHIRLFLAQKGPRAVQGYESLTACGRFAGYCSAHGLQHVIFAGRQTLPLTMPELPSAQSSEGDVQAYIDRLNLGVLQENAVRHRFVRQQAVRAIQQGKKKIIFLYGGRHTNKGFSEADCSNPPMDDFLSDLIQLSIFEPPRYSESRSRGPLNPMTMTAEHLLQLLRQRQSS